MQGVCSRGSCSTLIHLLFHWGWELGSQQAHRNSCLSPWPINCTDAAPDPQKWDSHGDSEVVAEDACSLQPCTWSVGQPLL